MKEVSSGNFGLLIAFLLPGFVVLWGVSYFSATVRLWLSGAGETPTVGGFMFVTLASVAAGVTVSTVRWLVVDTIHHWTGLAQPAWDFSRLQDNVGAYNVLNDIHYKFYQSHANGLIALVFVYVVRRMHQGLLTSGETQGAQGPGEGPEEQEAPQVEGVITDGVAGTRPIPLGRVSVAKIIDANPADSDQLL